MRQSLSEWEKYFEPFFGRVTLLGEIPFSSLECEEVGSLICRLVKNQRQVTATNFLKRIYPRSFCMFLVGMGLYGYSEGDYWTAVKETTGIHSPHQLGWGELFLGILRSYDLPLFSEIGGHRFLTPILAHGGIPEKSLGDFFNYVLEPWRKKPEYAGLSGREYAPQALAHLESYPAVDRPIKRFLEYGDEAAWDFLDQCLAMFRFTEQNGEIPLAHEVRLPPYVLRGYRQYLDDAPVVGSNKRLRTPRLFLNAAGARFTLNFPPQSIEATRVGSGYFIWQFRLRLCLESGESSYTTWESRRFKAKSQGYDILTREDEAPIDDPAHEIEIRFGPEADTLDGIEVWRTWQLYLQPTADQPPLAVFRYPEGAAVRWNQTLPTGTYWLLVPRKISLFAEGGEYFEEGGKFFGPWEAWKLEAWDLEKAITLNLLVGDQACCPPIPLRQAMNEPELTGGERLSMDRDPDWIPVYVGLPPALRLPLRRGRSLNYELSQWQIKLASRWAANPELDLEIPLSELTGLSQADEGSIDIPLRRWLGNRPAGTYHLSATGPGGLNGEFRFRIWPELLIENLERYYLPGAAGAKPVIFLLQVTAGCFVQSQPGVESTCVVGKDSTFQVTVASESTLAELQLIEESDRQEPIRLPLSLAVPRLKWGLSLDGDGAQLVWRTSPFKLSVDALLQSRQPGLHLEFALQDTETLTVRLQLVNSNTGEQLKITRKPILWKPGQARGYFPLGEFSDSFHHYDKTSNFEIRLEVLDPEKPEILYVPLLQVVRQIEIEYVLLNPLEPPYLEVVWDEPRPLRNRRVRFISLWQPWLNPYEVRIPDNAQECFTFAANLPPSRYSICFFTAAVWETIDPGILPPGAMEFERETISPDERLIWLEQQLEKEGVDQFLCHFERACIFETLQRSELCNNEISWCYSNLEIAAPKVLLAFYKWLNLRDPATQKAVAIKMFYPKALRQALEHKSDYPDLYRAYLDVFPFIRRNMIYPESALLLLDAETDPAVISHAFQALFEREHPAAVERILFRVSNGLLSEADAEQLLALKPRFSFQQLDAAPESPIRDRLLVWLLQNVSDMDGLLTKGRWIRCDAGIGIVTKITRVVANQEIPYAFINAKDIILNITLRPGDKPENIQIDLIKRQIFFPGTATIYYCARDHCRGFISAEQRAVTNSHNHAAHDGIRASFGPSENPTWMKSHIELLNHMPDNLFA